MMGEDMELAASNVDAGGAVQAPDRDQLGEKTSIEAEPVVMQLQLQQTGLLDYLRLDLRPSLVIDCDTGSLAFQNAAFESWRRSLTASASLPTWIAKLTSYAVPSKGEFGGLSWTFVKLHSRWLVVSSNGNADAGGSIEISSASPSSSSSLHKPLAVSGGANSDFRKSFDWIRFPTEGLSEHLRAIRKFPWHTTSVGPIDEWSPEFRQFVLTVTANAEPTVLLWGYDRVLIYNEACIPLFAQKHPQALGSRTADVWADEIVGLEPFLKRAEDEGLGTTLPRSVATLATILTTDAC